MTVTFVYLQVLPDSAAQEVPTQVAFRRETTQPPQNPRPTYRHLPGPQEQPVTPPRPDPDRTKVGTGGEVNRTVRRQLHQTPKTVTSRSAGHQLYFYFCLLIVKTLFLPGRQINE